jgi:hypothetical protein
MFLKYLEAREKINCDERDLKQMRKRKKVAIPNVMTAERFRNMTLNEQYEAVFGPIDPSRHKLKDLPYLVRIVTRKRVTEVPPSETRESVQTQTNSNGTSNGPSKVMACCVYCSRPQCLGCPLRFDDKQTLR